MQDAEVGEGDGAGDVAEEEGEGEEEEEGEGDMNLHGTMMTGMKVPLSTVMEMDMKMMVMKVE